MKKVFALLAISGMATFYACGGGENKEETTEQTTEQTTTEQTTTAATATGDSAQQAAPADTSAQKQGQ